MISVIQFIKYVVIDLVCYRRRGHNEADEPVATQPMMYQVISKKRRRVSLYADPLVQEGVLTSEPVQELVEEYRTDLENGKHVAQSISMEPNKEMFVDWPPYLGHKCTTNFDTRFPFKRSARTWLKKCVNVQKVS